MILPLTPKLFRVTARCPIKCTRPMWQSAGWNKPLPSGVHHVTSLASADWLRGFSSGFVGATIIGVSVRRQPWGGRTWEGGLCMITKVSSPPFPGHHCPCAVLGREQASPGLGNPGYMLLYVCMVRVWPSGAHCVSSRAPRPLHPFLTLHSTGLVCCDQRSLPGCPVSSKPC